MNPTAQRMFAKRAADANTVVRAGVGVIVRDEDGRILLEKRRDCGLWGLPGGRIEAGESVAQAARREVKEETGLTVRITRLQGVYSEPTDRIVTFPDNVVQLVDIVLEATVVSGELAGSDESETIQFFDPASLPPDVVPPAKLPLQHAAIGRAGVVR